MISVFDQTVKYVEDGGYSYFDPHLNKTVFVSLEFDPHLPQDTKLYTHEIHPTTKHDYITECSVLNQDCLHVAKHIASTCGEVCLLNMSSRRNPCGSVISGEGAQEEYLSICSDYYRSLFQFAWNKEKYGKYNIAMRQGESYPLDYDFGGVYSPNVTFFREKRGPNDYVLTKPWKSNIIAVPGIDSPLCIQRNDKRWIEEDVVPIIKNRIRTIFRIAIDNKQTNLVLSAWGCGAYKNPPEHIATLFKEILCESEFTGAFAKILFAILETDKANPNDNYKIFKKILEGG